MGGVTTHYMVVRQDTHGTRYLMKDGLTREAAERYLTGFLAAQLKAHHQDYEIVAYDPLHRAERLQELEIKA